MSIHSIYYTHYIYTHYTHTCSYVLYILHMYTTGHNSDRDLKPGNLLVSKDCQLRITDFGLARYMDEDTLQGVYTILLLYYLYYTTLILCIHVYIRDICI